MHVRALRGVCVGVGRHLAASDTADLDAATVQFLVSIGAVEKIDAPVVAEPETATPAKAGKKEK